MTTSEPPASSPSPAAADDATVRAQLELVGSADNLRFLSRYLAAAHPSLASHDADDIAAGVLTRLMARVRAGQWQPQPEQTMLHAYLRTAANWAVIDSYRSALGRHEQSLPPESLRELVLSDDDTAAALEHAATASSVLAALRRIQHDGDTTLFRVVTYLLDELQRSGVRPSNRQIAAAVGLSHTAVANALVRVRPYFGQARATTQPDSG